MIRFACSQCQSSIEVSEDQGGTSVRCFRCGQTQAVPTLLPLDTGSAAASFTSSYHSGVSQALASPRRRLSGFVERLKSLVQAPRRLASPSALLLALICFPLPWVQIQCDRPIADSGSRTLVEQSGLQAAYGGYSENPAIQDMRTGRKPDPFSVNSRGKEPRVSASPWMVFYPLLLLGAMLGGLLIRKKQVRIACLIVGSLFAGIVLLVQARSGFPLEQAFPSTVTSDVAVGTGFKLETSTPTPFQTHYTGWFWLTAAAVLAAFVAACWDAWWEHRKRQPAWYRA